MAITQQDYLNDSPSVKAARKKLTAAKAALSDAKKAKEGLGRVPGNKQIADQVEKRIADAQKELDAIVSEVTAVETKAKNYFEKNKDTILAKAAKKDAAKQVAADEAVKAQIAAMKRAGLDTTALENQLASRKKKTKTEETNAAETGTEPGTPQVQPDDFAGMLKKSTQFIREMSGPERKFLAQQLNDALGTKLLVSELVDPGSLLAAYNGAISAAKARYDQFQDIPTLDGFLNLKKIETAQIKAAGGSENKPWGQIYDASQAKSTISGVITNLLNREATDKEIASITKKLMKAQADNPYRKNAKGMTIGGINAEQFVTDLVKSMPEYETKKLAKEDLTAQDIAETARLNGFNLSQSELKSYSNRVKNGEDIKVIENEIRKIAGMGQPDSIKKMLDSGTNLDTIFSPYKRVMASSLDLDPNAISLDDATLRAAIGPDKEMSLYDFKKAIRKDNRWRFSKEANDEVGEMINQVKRDFGFMG